MKIECQVKKATLESERRTHLFRFLRPARLQLLARLDRMLRAAGRRKMLQSTRAHSLPPCTCSASALVASPFASTSRLQLLHSAPTRYARPKKASVQPTDSTLPPHIPTEALDAEPVAGPSAALEPTRMQMRPYQLDVISAVLDTLREGEYTRLGVSAPTGASGLREGLKRRAGREGIEGGACGTAVVSAHRTCSGSVNPLMPCARLPPLSLNITSRPFALADPFSLSRIRQNRHLHLSNPPPSHPHPPTYSPRSHQSPHSRRRHPTRQAGRRNGTPSLPRFGG